LTDESYTILSLLRSYTLDGAPSKQDEGGDAGEGQAARCGIKEKYPFAASANLTEDSIITDPVEIKKFIEDFAVKNKDTEDKAPAEPEPAKPKGKGGKQEKPKPTPKQNKNQAKAMTLKMLIQKTVPYSSAVYAEHAFR
jgi:hypothetical protein